jgi:heme exporter protein C
VWWTPSPRLISSAVLWLLYAAYLILRAGLPAEHRKETISAVFGIIAFIDVPLVIISARFIRDIHRPTFSFDTPAQMLALASATLGSVLLMTLLIRYLKLSKERSSAHTQRQ